MYIYIYPYAEHIKQKNAATPKHAGNQTAARVETPNAQWRGAATRRFVAVCCSVLQRVVVCRSALQCVAVCRIVLQLDAKCSAARHCNAEVCCSVLQHAEARCSVLQCDANQ